MNIDYDHNANVHSLEGPAAAISHLFKARAPSSLVDVGCGTGTWLRAAIDYGIHEVCGIDGVQIPSEALKFPASQFHCHDLSAPWDLRRKFDAALCLEVAEHLDPSHAETLIRTIAAHSDLIVFSAACPGQPGQHHVNCQWPCYWQALFNANGFSCDDSIRWRIWDDRKIEPWYRQNMLIAKADPKHAGNEPRLRAVVHPEMVDFFRWDAQQVQMQEIEQGRVRLPWYGTSAAKAVMAKIRRKFRPKK